MFEAVVDCLTCRHQLSKEVLSNGIFIGNLTSRGIRDVVMQQTFEKHFVNTEEKGLPIELNSLGSKICFLLSIFSLESFNF